MQMEDNQKNRLLFSHPCLVRLYFYLPRCAASIRYIPEIQHLSYQLEILLISCNQNRSDVSCGYGYENVRKEAFDSQGVNFFVFSQFQHYIAGNIPLPFGHCCNSKIVLYPKKAFSHRFTQIYTDISKTSTNKVNHLFGEDFRLEAPTSGIFSDVCFISVYPWPTEVFRIRNEVSRTAFCLN